jgi:hypothetical protein
MSAFDIGPDVELGETVSLVPTATLVAARAHEARIG